MTTAKKLIIIDTSPIVGDDPPKPLYHIEGGLYRPEGKYVRTSKSSAVREFYAGEQLPGHFSELGGRIWVGATRVNYDLKEYLFQEKSGGPNKENPFTSECQLMKKIIRAVINEDYPDVVPIYLSFVIPYPFENQVEVDRNDPRWPAHLIAINEDGTCGVFCNVNMPEGF